jgi:hypothetical protein
MMLCPLDSKSCVFCYKELRSCVCVCVDLVQVLTLKITLESTYLVTNVL